MLHEPLKITIKLDFPAAIDRKSAFDSILAKIYFNRLDSQGLFDGNYQMPLGFLKMTDGVYHTSFPVFEKEHNTVWYEKGIIMRRMNEKAMCDMVDFGTKMKPIIGSGKYKADFYAKELLPYDEVVYYVCGEKRMIADLLSYLSSIGKKSGFGWGKIKENGIFIETLEEDHSILYRGRLNRNIPYENSFGYTGETIAFHRLTHPYWERSGLEACYLPEGGVW